MFFLRSILLCFALAFSQAAGPVAAADLTGSVHVIDGDTFDVGRVRIRLFGIDAVEHDQTCQSRQGQRLACGRWVIEQVRALYEGRQAVCADTGARSYGRVVASCRIAGEDVGRRLVSDGLAFAYLEYSDRYLPEQRQAERADRGLWQTAWQPPAEFRHRPQATAPVQAASGCVIKGNISSSGRIYHVPGGRDYDATVITPSRGERWFCSEAEARAAGWRAARR